MEKYLLTKTSITWWSGVCDDVETSHKLSLETYNLLDTLIIDTKFFIYDYDNEDDYTLEEYLRTKSYYTEEVVLDYCICFPYNCDINDIISIKLLNIESVEDKLN